MSSESLKILLTGVPGCGKTTAVIRVAEELRSARPLGFYTQEIREDDRRVGFCWKRFDGPAGVLAHVNIKGRFRVGKYGVDVAAFERSVVPILTSDRPDAGLFIIDEIGKMECLSAGFVTAVRRLFESEVSILATVAKKGGGFISEVKDYPGVRLLDLKRRGREEMIAEIIRVLSVSHGSS